MKIIQILPELNVGGVETGVLDFALGLVKRGHKSIVISNGGRLLEQLVQEGSKHFRLKVHSKSPLTILRMIREVRKIIKAENPDIVHARSRVPALIAFFACQSTGTTFITTAHGYYSKNLMSRVMGWGKFVIVASNIMGKRMNEEFGVPHQRLRLIPRGVDIGKFAFRPSSPEQRKEFVIGVIGRLSPGKGHKYFIKAIAKVMRRTSNIKVLIVGGIKKRKEHYKQELVILVRRLGLERIVEFTGAKDNIPEVLSKLDVLVLPTASAEAFGRVIIEANAVGTPVVATKVGGIVDVIEDEVNGLLVTPQDPDSLAQAILRLLKDVSLRRLLVKNARIKVEKEYSLELMVDRTLAVYNEALGTLRILLIKIGSLGDVILVLPSLRAVRAKFPKAHISVLVGSAAAEIIQRSAYVDEVIVYERQGRHKGLMGFLKIRWALRRINFDISIDFQNNKFSHSIAYLSGIHKRYGYDNGKFGTLLSHKINDLGMDKGPVEHQFRMLNLIGISSSVDEIEIPISKEEEDFADRFLESHWLGKEQKLIGINIGASPKWHSKKWSLKNFAALSDKLTSKYQARILITGSKEEVHRVGEFLKFTKSKPIAAVGKTSLLQLAALIKRCDIFITGDSAPMHIAAGVRTPFVALFGPTDPKRHLPPAKNYAVVSKKIPCVPCYKPRCEEMKCMEEITVENVMKAVEWVMQKREICNLGGNVV